jgi:lipid-A-disaccharide synthase
MRYYIIAGEPSGDLHASNFMKELKQVDAKADFCFLGGDLMERAVDRKPTIHIQQMAFMGFVDVVKNLGKISGNFKIVKKDILQYKPDVLILVDYPGFNLRMAKWAKENGLKVFYYISPTVWAWKESRVEKVKKYIDRLFVIFPFEEAFYKKHDYKVHFVGHPLMDEIEERKKTLLSREEFVKKNSLSSKPIIAVLPGSRKQEIERMLDSMLEVIKNFPNYEFVIGGAGHLSKDLYSKALAQNIKVVFDQTYELMSYAKAGVIKSGTSTLECALFNLPEVVCYKGGQASYLIAKQLIKVKYISIVNLIMDKPVVKELIQSEMNSQTISAELKELLNNNEYRNRILADYKELQVKLGGAGASKRLANAIYTNLMN